FAASEDRMGVHPNFLAGSSHGATLDEVCDHVIAMNPKSRFYRSHCFYETSQVADAFRKRGFEFDSNLNLASQSALRPFVHPTGLVRYPQFFGDGNWFTHHAKEGVDRLMPLVAAPGLKIFNFHPLHVCLNTPDQAYYQAFRESKLHWRNFVYTG